MAAQAPYMLLNTNPGATSTTRTTSNVNTSYYQARTNQNSGFDQRNATPASYISYPSNVSGSGGGYYRTTTTQSYQGGPNVHGSTISTTSTSTVTSGTTATTTNKTGSSALTVASTSQKTPAFRAPAHKHAHHLHSIPPREKSTRTLIVDHMLWVHGRTRFAQARAELGMTDRTGGPSSSNYAHRTRPENYEEEDEVGSEGEDASVLRARGIGSNDRSEEVRLRKQDLPLARTLRLRAEGLEKVVTSMLEQPPPVPHQPSPDDYSHQHHYHHHHHHSHSHWQKYEGAPNTRTGKHPHTLPNGVRLRLALGTIINDFFARQAPHPPYRHTNPSVPSEQTAVSDTPPPRDVQPTPTPSPDNLPEALLPLIRVSGVFNNSSDPQHHRSPSAQSPGLLTYTPTGSPYQSFSSPQQYPPQPQYHHAGPSPFIVPGSQIYNAQPPPPQSPPHPRGPVTRPTPPQRALSLYATGAEAATPPHTSRCPRHLQTGCEICVEAKSRVGSSSGSSGRAFIVPSSSSAGGLSSIGGGYGAGGTANGITGWQDGSGMGTGLLKPGLRGSVLRRKVYLGNEKPPSSTGSSPASSGSADSQEFCTGAGNTKLSKLIPRFIKLSALVAAELGREVRGEEVDESSSSASEAGEGSEKATPLAQEQQRMYDYALKPTREWYMLLAGLLTRAVLEGYLTAGWRGTEAAECLLLLGLNVNPDDLVKDDEEEADDEEEEAEEGDDVTPEEDDEERKKKRRARKWKKRRRKLEFFDEDDEFSEFHPDEYPTLFEAVRVLFPSLRSSSATSGKSRKGKGRAEAEYEAEMYERLRRFYDIPASTPDLATHMEDLVWQYPAEPVERAAVRFCEAVAKWRGKPELQTYKKKPPPKPPSSTASSDPIQQLFSNDVLSIDSLVHSNPTSPTLAHTGSNPASGVAAIAQYGSLKKLKKPSIDVYFGTRESGESGSSSGWTPAGSSSPTASKRRRPEDDVGEGRELKRVHA